MTYGEWLKLDVKQRFEVFEMAITNIYNQKLQLSYQENKNIQHF